jgi:hypothetical protein
MNERSWKVKFIILYVDFEIQKLADAVLLCSPVEEIASTYSDKIDGEILGGNNILFFVYNRI